MDSKYLVWTNLRVEAASRVNKQRRNYTVLERLEGYSGPLLQKSKRLLVLEWWPTVPNLSLPSAEWRREGGV